MVRIIISDEFGQHGIDIKTAISNGYSSDISAQIQIIGGWSASFAEAQSNANIVALIRSTSGVAGYVTNASSICPRVQTFFPLGSNVFEELNVFANNEPPVIITSGAGDEELRNNTGYGKGLEFWDQDLSTPTPADDQSSFSNGYVLGKLLKIKDTLNCTWWEARYRARETADRNEPNRVTSPWDLRNGYGKINVNAAVAYVGLIPPDPYLPDALAIENAALQLANDNLTAYSITLQNNIAELTIDNAALQAANTLLAGYQSRYNQLLLSIAKRNPVAEGHQNLLTIINTL